MTVVFPATTLFERNSQKNINMVNKLLFTQSITNVQCTHLNATIFLTHATEPILTAAFSHIQAVPIAFA